MFFPIFITIGIPKVFQEEVPRAKARQQLREAQNNDASWGLSAEKWVRIQGPPKPLMLVKVGRVVCVNYPIDFIHPWQNDPQWTEI